MKNIALSIIMALLLPLCMAGQNGPDRDRDGIRGPVTFYTVSYYDVERQGANQYKRLGDTHIDKSYKFTADGYSDGPFVGVYSVELPEGERVLWKNLRAKGVNRAQWKGHTVVVTRDVDGYITEIDIDGVEHWQYKWDKSNRRITRKYGVVPAGDGPGTVIIDNEYDADGRVSVSRSTYPEMGMEVRTNRYEYQDFDKYGNWRQCLTVTTDEDSKEIDLYLIERRFKY